MWTLSFLSCSELSCSFPSLDPHPTRYPWCFHSCELSVLSMSLPLGHLHLLPYDQFPISLQLFPLFISLWRFCFVLTPHPLLMMHFCKMYCEFIPMRQGGNATTCWLSVCVWIEWWMCRDQLLTVMKVTRLTSNHDMHLLFTQGFLDQKASGEVCALCNSALIYCDNWSWFQLKLEPCFWGYWCYVTKLQSLKFKHFGTTPSEEYLIPVVNCL